MTKTTILLLSIAWIASLIITNHVAKAQTRPYSPLPEPKVFSGSELAFRVDGVYGETPAGSLVIRQNGHWVDVQIGTPGIVR
jgi:hypothetical protein